MIFNIVYHTPDTITRTREIDEAGSNGNGLSIEVQMAWGGSSTYNFQVSSRASCVLFYSVETGAKRGVLACMRASLLRFAMA